MWYLKILNRLYLLLLLLAVHVPSTAQSLPDPNIFGFYSLSGNNIYEHNCIANTEQIVFNAPVLGSALGVGQVLGSANPTQTYYLVIGGTYHYVDPVTLQIVNTGHSTTAVNPGVGSRYIFNFQYPNIYRYDGASNDILIRTLTPADGSRFIYDVFADCEDNFYLINSTHLQKYDSTATLLQSWPHNIPNFPIVGAGIALIQDSLYFSFGNTIYVSGIQGANLVYNRTYTLTSPSPLDMANYKTSPISNINITIRVIDSLSCGQNFTIQASIPGNITNPVYTWYVNGNPLPGNNSPMLQRSFNTGDVIYVRINYNGNCINTVFSNTITIGNYNTRHSQYDSTVCYGQSVWGYSLTGIYRDTFRQGLCDSIRTLNLTVRPLPIARLFSSYCNPVFPVVWNNHTIAQAGSYILMDTSVQSVTGCDSLTIMNMTITLADTTVLYDTTCFHPDGYPWYGNRLTQSGTYTHTLTNRHNCDSVLILRLLVHDDRPTTENVLLQDCQSVTYKGHTYFSDTSLADTFRNVHFCDSHYVVTNIKVHYPQTQYIDTTLCGQETFTLNGITYGNPGTYLQQYTDRQGCDSNIRIQIWLSSLPVFSIDVTPKDKLLCLGDTVHVKAEGDYIFDWKGLPVDSIDNRHQSYYLDSLRKTFPFTVTNRFGCTIEDSLLFLADKCCELIFPNAFSPNNDGLNDRFGPFYVSGLNDFYRMQIFNRWGQRVFISFNVNEQWDGTFNSKRATADVYYYYVEYTCNDKRKYEFKGNFTLIY